MQTRGKTPAERAIFQAAGAFFAEETVEIDFGLDGFDAPLPASRPNSTNSSTAASTPPARVFSQAAWAGMAARLPDGGEGTFDLQPILFAATGTTHGLTGFAGDGESLPRSPVRCANPASFRRPARSRSCPWSRADAVDLYTVGPAAVHALTEGLAALVEADTPEEGAGGGARGAGARPGLPTISEGEGARRAFFSASA